MAAGTRCDAWREQGLPMITRFFKVLCCVSGFIRSSHNQPLHDCTMQIGGWWLVRKLVSLSDRGKDFTRGALVIFRRSAMKVSDISRTRFGPSSAHHGAHSPHMHPQPDNGTGGRCLPARRSAVGVINLHEFAQTTRRCAPGDGLHRFLFDESRIADALRQRIHCSTDKSVPSPSANGDQRPCRQGNGMPCNNVAPMGD